MYWPGCPNSPETEIMYHQKPLYSGLIIQTGASAQSETGPHLCSHIQIGTQSYRLAQLLCFILSLYSFFKVHTLVELQAYRISTEFIHQLLFWYWWILISYSNFGPLLPDISCISIMLKLHNCYHLIMNTPKIGNYFAYICANHLAQMNSAIPGNLFAGMIVKIIRLG